MKVFDFSEENRRELVFHCMNASWNESPYFYVYNDLGKFTYSKEEILELDHQAGLAFHEFSDLIHQIPNSNNIATATTGSMWREYEKIFFCGTLPSLPKTAHKLAGFAMKSVPDKFFASVETYNDYLAKDDELQLEILNLFNSGLTGSEAKMEDLKLQFKANYTEWKDKGRKDEIENLFDEQFAETNFSVVRLWSTWKQKMLTAENAGFMGVHSKFADFYANFKRLINPLDWNNCTIKLSELSASQHEHLELAKGISALKFDMQLLEIKRNWFSEEVFDADFWQWHPEYVSDLLSYGLEDNTFKGELPSYIDSVVFIKNIQYRPKFNFLLDLLEWVGRFFKEIPYEDLFEEHENHIYLLAFKSKKLPKSPKNR